MSTYPKSPKEMTGGMMWFPRLIDKIRLHARGELSEDYHANLGEGFDKRCLGFLRVDYANLCERTLAGGTDEEVLDWCFEKGRPLDKGDLFIWKSFVSKFGWNDVATNRLNELKEKFGFGDRKDIVTIAELLDLDEGRHT
ncbi:MAG: DUF5069 domain-containing protein [Chthoniobacterales bacterium]